MKKVLLSFALLLGIACMIPNTSSAQESSAGSVAFSGAGDKKLQLGFNGYGYGSGISGSFDYGVHEFISIGVGANFYFGKLKYANANLFLFGRVNLHLNPLLNLPSQLDIYPGVDLGYYNEGFGWNPHLGIRYLFTPKIGIYAEAGRTGALGVVFNL